MRLCLLLNVLF